MCTKAKMTSFPENFENYSFKQYNVLRPRFLIISILYDFYNLAINTNISSLS